MRSQQKWWFLSEADEEQPGTDRDIDYYQHKSKEDEELQPPPRVVEEHAEMPALILYRSCGAEV